MSTNVKELSRKAGKASPNTFQPTDAQKRAKYAFWSHFLSSGDLPPTQIELATASRFSGFTGEVEEWWSIEGFQEWFSNGEEFRQKVEYLAIAALDVLQELLLDPQAKAGDRLQAARTSLEIASKFPKQAPKEAAVGDKISQMSKAELEAYISQKLSILPQPAKQPIDKPE